jgi:hypothetical protein
MLTKRTLSYCFYDLAIGDKFHTGKSKGMGDMKDVTYYMVYVKDSKSEAHCIEQVGYGNTRLVGSKKSFASGSIVWRVQ